MQHPLNELVAQPLETLTLHVAGLLDPEERREEVLGKKLAGLLRKGPAPALVKLALINDCLRVFENILAADPSSARARVNAAAVLLKPMAGFYARVRHDYRRFATMHSAQLGDFVRSHRLDVRLFGGACPRTRWLGREICHRAARLGQDPSLIQRYERMTSGLSIWLTDSHHQARASADSSAVALGSEPPAATTTASGRRLEGFDVTDADDAPVAAPEPAAPPAPAIPEPVPGAKYFLQPLINSFSLHHGKLQIQYCPPGFGLGYVWFNVSNLPPEGWQEISREQYEVLKGQILTELRHFLDSAGTRSLSHIRVAEQLPREVPVQPPAPEAVEEGWGEDEIDLRPGTGPEDQTALDMAPLTYRDGLPRVEMPAAEPPIRPATPARSPRTY